MGFEYGFVEQCMHLAVLARNLNIRIAPRETDAVFLEGVADSVVSFASDGELAFTRIRGALHSHHHSEFFHANDAPGFQGLDHMGSKLRIGLELGANFFCNLLDESDVGFERYAEFE